MFSIIGGSNILKICLPKKIFKIWDNMREWVEQRFHALNEGKGWGSPCLSVLIILS